MEVENKMKSTTLNDFVTVMSVYLMVSLVSGIILGPGIPLGIIVLATVGIGFAWFAHRRYKQ